MCARGKTLAPSMSCRARSLEGIRHRSADGTADAQDPTLDLRSCAFERVKRLAAGKRKLAISIGARQPRGKTEGQGLQMAPRLREAVC